MEDKPKKPKVKKPRKSRVGQKQKQTQIVTVNVLAQDKPKPKRKPRAKPKPKTIQPSASFGLPSTYGGAGALASGQPFRQVIYAPSQDVRGSIQSLEKSIAALSQAGGSQMGDDKPPLEAVGNIGDKSFKTKSRSSEESSDETRTQMSDADDYQSSSLSGAESQLKKAGLRPSRKQGFSNLGSISEGEQEPRVARGYRADTMAGLPTEQQTAQAKKQAQAEELTIERKVLKDSVTGKILKPQKKSASQGDLMRMLDRDAAIAREQQQRAEVAEEEAEPLGEQGGGGIVYA